MFEKTNAQFILVGRSKIAPKLKEKVEIERPPIGDMGVRKEENRGVQLKLPGEKP